MLCNMIHIPLHVARPAQNLPHAGTTTGRKRTSDDKSNLYKNTTSIITKKEIEKKIKCQPRRKRLYKLQGNDTPP
jgi:hypothetical protein